MYRVYVYIVGRGVYFTLSHIPYNAPYNSLIHTRIHPHAHPITPSYTTPSYTPSFILLIGELVDDDEDDDLVMMGIAACNSGEVYLHPYTYHYTCMMCM